MKGEAGLSADQDRSASSAGLYASGGEACAGGSATLVLRNVKAFFVMEPRMAS
jgi:hypothetical protein